MEDQHGIAALASFAGALVVAEIIKLAIEFAKRGSLKEAMTKSARTGGMPSGHTASFVALLTYFGLALGINSSIFALTLAVSLVVIYDSLHVRFAVGELGEAVKRLVKKTESGKAPEVVRGHKLLEVIVGTMIGVAMGFLVFYIQQQR